MSRRTFLIGVVLAAGPALAADDDLPGHLFAERVGAVRVGQPAPTLELAGLLQAGADQTVDWPSLRGNVVVLEFWATWCAPCLVEIPHLNRLAKAFADEPVIFISVTDEERPVVEESLGRQEMRSWVGLDADGATSASYGIGELLAMPATFVVGTDGRLAAITVPKALTEEVLRDLLSDGTAPPTSLFEVSIRPSSAPAHSSSNALGRFSARRVRPQWLVGYAFEAKESQIIDQAGLSDRFYDVLVAAPEGRERTKPLLKAALESAFGIRVRRETRPTDVFELRRIEDAQATNLRPTDAVAGEPSTTSMQDRQLEARNASSGTVAAMLETLLKRRVLDETDLDGSFDWTLSFEDRSPETIRAAVKDQLGFELVPARKPIEFVIVEPDGN